MRVLFTTQPGIGHLHPLLPLARGMAQHGHTVAFACARGFVPEAQRAGCGAFPVGRDWLTVELEQEFPEIREILPGPACYAWVRANAGATARQTDPAETAPTHHRLRPASAVLAPEEGEESERTVAVRAVLEDPKYRSNAQRLRQQTQTLPGLEHGIRLLERLANENAPHRP
jgi:UDP:flavonoid glycosyltransferase YjiC (YdhE family)